MDKNQTKATLILLGGIGIFVVIIILAAIFMGRSDKENFPDYEEFDIKESDVVNNSSQSYKDTRDRLQKDKYFTNEVLLNEFNSDTFTKMLNDKNFDFDNYKGASLRELIWNYIHSYELSNREYLTLLSKSEGIFCMKKRYVIDSFKELYNIDLTDQLTYLPGYFEYVSLNDNGTYCFNYDQVLSEYQNEIKVGIERIAVTGNTVVTDLYVYEYLNNGADDQELAVKNLDYYIANQNYDNAKKVVEQYLFGNVTHKQIKLKINSRGKFFKYQILSVKILNN